MLSGRTRARDILALKLFLHPVQQNADDLYKLLLIGHFINQKSLLTLLTWTFMPCQENSNF